jgi:hypothetical protein
MPEKLFPEKTRILGRLVDFDFSPTRIFTAFVAIAHNGSPIEKTWSGPQKFAIFQRHLSKFPYCHAINKTIPTLEEVPRILKHLKNEGQVLDFWVVHRWYDSGKKQVVDGEWLEGFGPSKGVHIIPMTEEKIVRLDELDFEPESEPAPAPEPAPEPEKPKVPKIVLRRPKRGDCFNKKQGMFIRIVVKGGKESKYVKAIIQFDANGNEVLIGAIRMDQQGEWFNTIENAENRLYPSLAPWLVAAAIAANAA